MKKLNALKAGNHIFCREVNNIICISVFYYQQNHILLTILANRRIILLTKLRLTVFKDWLNHKNSLVILCFEIRYKRFIKIFKLIFIVCVCGIFLPFETIEEIQWKNSKQVKRAITFPSLYNSCSFQSGKNITTWTQWWKTSPRSSQPNSRF